MNHFDLEVAGGVAVMWMDTPGERVNMLSRAMAEEFEQTLDAIAANPEAKAAVLISRKPDSFVVGADIGDLMRINSAGEAMEAVQESHRLLNKLERLPKPVVAAVHGPCVGGGLELALACRYRLATDHRRTFFALPEVKLGLLPAAGGTQRLPRLIGLTPALEAMLTGKSIYARPARALGLVDATIHSCGLLDAAKRAALGLVSGAVEAARRRSSARELALERTPLKHLVWRQVEKRVQRETRGNYPAPPRIIDCVRTGFERGVDRGLKSEARHFGDLLFTPESKALVNLFFLKNAAEKNPHGPRVDKVARLGVLGAGLMGAGIAELAAAAGCDVVLKDRSLELAVAGKRAVFANLSRRVGKGLSAFELDTAMERITPVEDYALFRDVDLVIEALPEDLDLKRRVLADAEARSGEDAILATCTSAIPVHQIAAGVRRPERVVGMHYFSPAQKMPLLEVVAQAATPGPVLAAAIQVGLDQGKAVVVVNDRPGFFVNRILVPYLDEAVRLIAEGARIHAVDAAMRDFGFPVGPARLIDEVGIDVGLKVTAVLRDTFSERGVELMALDEKLLAEGIFGRKGGKGFYLYRDGKATGRANKRVYRYLGQTRRKRYAVGEMQQRMALSLINEAAYCLQEGVIGRPQDGDVAAVFGFGFPPFRGGPFWYCDRVGARSLVARLDELCATHGAKFEAAPLLREQARSGGRFY